jgi:hypothetical protein
MELDFIHLFTVPDLSKGFDKSIKSGLNITRQMSGGKDYFPGEPFSLSKGKTA